MNTFSFLDRDSNVFFLMIWFIDCLHITLHWAKAQSEETKTFQKKKETLIFPTWSVFGQKTKHPKFTGRVRLQEILIEDKKRQNYYFDKLQFTMGKIQRFILIVTR